MAASIARLLRTPRRRPLWATPADLGLPYEPAAFSAPDGVPLNGWFIPASDDSFRNGAAIILVHDWPWNRLGESADDPLSRLIGASSVDLLRLAFSLHQEGFAVLMYDVRNHGESGSSSPMTFGWRESDDLIGAADYLGQRDDVDHRRLGAVGFSMGANSLLFALPKTNKLAAVVAVQPVTPSIFAGRAASDLLGMLRWLVLPMAELLYRAYGGPPFAALRPLFAAANSGDTPILYVQGSGDRWGATEDVSAMAAASPQARGPLLVETTGRFEGFQYVLDNPKILSAFFEQHLPE
jgi:dienelactone hydrolase